MLIKRVVLSAALALGLSHVALASPLTFTDGFEGPSLDPFWTFISAGGSYDLTSSLAHSGSQSVHLTGPFANSLDHVFPLTWGSASVYAYGADITSQIDLSFSNGGVGAFEIAMNDPTSGGDFYTYSSTSGGWSGSTGYGLSDPGPGWFLLSVDDSPGGLTFRINGNIVRTAPSIQFDDVELDVHGGTAYFDDFSVTTVEAPSEVPEPASLLLLGTGLAAGVRLWRKRQPTA